MKSKTQLAIKIDLYNRELNDYKYTYGSFIKCIQSMPPNAPCLPELRKDLDEITDKIRETQILLYNTLKEYEAIKEQDEKEG